MINRETRSDKNEEYKFENEGFGSGKMGDEQSLYTVVSSVHCVHVQYLRTHKPESCIFMTQRLLIRYFGQSFHYI